MDEIWQRHKQFILQCVIGGLVFLIVLVLIGNTYSRTSELKVKNTNLKADLEKRLRQKQAPDRASITAQKQKAKDAQDQILAMAGQFASLAEGDAYVRENVRWILSTIGRPESDDERYLGLYREIPQSGLTSLREDARAVLVARAAQKGRQIDESFGLTAGVQDDEVPGAIHALAIVCDVVRRSLELDGISAITDVKVNPRNVIDREKGWLAAVEIRLSVVGLPDAVASLLRSFNRTEPPLRRATVLRDVESVARRNPDDDPVKATISLLGMQHRQGAE